MRRLGAALALAGAKVAVSGRDAAKAEALATQLQDTGHRALVDQQILPREREVLALVGEGMANKQIARALGISERTVKVHLNSVFRQLGVADRTSAALWAREHLTAF